MSRFDRISDVAPQEIWDGVLGRAVHGERVTLALVELEPSSVVPEHSHDNEQAGVLVEGSFEMRIGDETRTLTRGATWCIPPDEPHEVRVGPEGAVVIEVWAPAREDWLEIDRQEARPPRGF
jgi:quercetin dioxygenase-like cupin family protein